MVSEITLTSAVLVAIGIISALLEINLGGRKLWSYFFEKNGNMKGLSKLAMGFVLIVAFMPNLVSMSEEMGMILFYSAFSSVAPLGIKSFRLGGKNPAAGAEIDESNE